MGTDMLAFIRPALSSLSTASTRASGDTQLGNTYLILALATLVLLLAFYRRTAVGSRTGNVQLLPGGKPLIGHLIELLQNQHRFHDWILESATRMGWKTYCFTAPLLPTWFVVTDPTSLEYVLKTDMHNWVKGPGFYDIFWPILGHGIFTSDGPQWLWQRKLASHIFNVKGFKGYIDQVFTEHMDILSATFARAAAARSQLDLHDLMYRFTLDSFGKIGFGVQLGCLSSSEAKIPFAAAFDQAQMISVERLTSPGWGLTELLNGKRATLNACCGVIHGFAMGIVQQRRQLLAGHRAAASPTAPGAAAGSATLARGAADAPAADTSVMAHEEVGGSAQDLLSLFMESKGADGQPLNDKQLIDTVINFIIAGRDTTAQALSWTLYELLQHPEVEQQVLQELRAVLGPLPADSSSRQAVHPSYDQIRQLRFTRACLLEALRLHPSVPEDIKFAVRTGTLPDGSVIPAGCRLLYSPYVVNRSKAFWGADAEDFRPSRWLELDSMPSPYSYLSFNAGPRICLGQRLAEIEGVYVLAGLLARFKFSQVQPGSKVGYIFSTTLPMKQGLLVTVAERE